MPVPGNEILVFQQVAGLCSN